MSSVQANRHVRHYCCQEEAELDETRWEVGGGRRGRSRALSCGCLAYLELRVPLISASGAESILTMKFMVFSNLCCRPLERNFKTTSPSVSVSVSVRKSLRDRQADRVTLFLSNTHTHTHTHTHTQTNGQTGCAPSLVCPFPLTLICCST